MATEKIKTRIIHKHDTEANWNKATSFIPKQGELIIYDRDDNHDYERMKIGDGETSVINLTFIEENFNADFTNQIDKLDLKKLDKEEYFGPVAKEGNPVVYEKGLEGLNISAVTEFIPKQAGSGDPYPAGGGKNLFCPLEDNIANNKGVIITTTKGSSEFNLNGLATGDNGSIPIAKFELPAGTYTASVYGLKNDDWIILTDYTGDTETNIFSSLRDNSPKTFTIDNAIVSRIKLVCIADMSAYNNETVKLQIEAGSTVTEYAPCSNIRPISGWNALNLVRSGKNLIDKDNLKYSGTPRDTIDILDTGLRITATAAGTYRATYMIIGPTEYFMGKTLTFSADMKASASNVPRALISVRTPANTFVEDIKYLNYGAKSATMQIPHKEEFIGNNLCLTLYSTENGQANVGDYSEYTNLMLEFGSEASTYETGPKDTYTVQIGQTVYGGTMNWLTGELVAEYELVELTGNENINVYSESDLGKSLVIYNILNASVNRATGFSSHTLVHKYLDAKNRIVVGNNNRNIYWTTIADILGLYTEDEVAAWFAAQRAAGTPVQIVYKLKTPQTIQLTSYQISSLQNINTLYGDGNIKAIFNISPTVKNKIEDNIGVLPIEKGGTSATNITGARAALGIPEEVVYLNGIKDNIQNQLDKMDLKKIDIEEYYGFSKAEGNPVISKNCIEGQEIRVETEFAPKQEGHGVPYPGGSGKNLFSGCRNAVNCSYSNNEITLGTEDTDTYIYLIFDSKLKNLVSAGDSIYLSFKAKNIVNGWTWGFNSVEHLSNGDCSIPTDGSAKILSYTITENILNDGYIILDDLSRSSITRPITQNMVFYDIGIYLSRTDASNYEPYSNIRAIKNYDNLSLTRTGKNLLNLDKKYISLGVNYITLTDNGFEANGGAPLYAFDISYLPKAATFTVSAKTTANVRVSVSETNTGYELGYIFIEGNGSLTFTTPNNFDTLYLVFYKSDSAAFNASNIQIEFGSASTSYQPYQGDIYTVEIDEMVYGGKMNWLTGELVAEYGFVELDGSSDEQWSMFEGSGGTSFYTSADVMPNHVFTGDWNIRGFCSWVASNDGVIEKVTRTNATSNRVEVRSAILAEWGMTDDLDAFKTKLASNPMQIAYKLATPKVIQLTPQQITTLEGINTLYGDGDNLIAEFGHESSNSISPILKEGSFIDFNKGIEETFINPITYFEIKQEGSGEPYPGGSKKNLANPPRLNLMPSKGTFEYDEKTYTIKVTKATTNENDWGQLYYELDCDATSLVGQTVTLSIQDFSISDTSDDPRIFLTAQPGGTTITSLYPQGTYNSYGHIAKSNSGVVPEGTTKFRVIIRTDQNCTLPVGTVMTVKGLQVEIGDTVKDTGVNAPVFVPYSNIRPLVGYNSLNLIHCGKNLCNPDNIEYAGNVSISNGVVTQVSADTLTPIAVKAQYYNNEGEYSGHIGSVSNITSPGRISFTFNKTKNVGGIRYGVNGAVMDSMCFIPLENLPNGEYTVSANFTNVTQGSVSWKDMQIEAGSKVTDFEPYQGNTYTAQIGETIYGGKIDWSTGELIADMILHTYSSSDYIAAAGSFENRTQFVWARGNKAFSGEKLICSHFAAGTNAPWQITESSGYPHNMYLGFPVDYTLENVRAWFDEQASLGTPVQVAYKLETPVTIQLTPYQIASLKGLNSIYGNGYIKSFFNVINSLPTVLPIERGGTGGKTPSEARAALGITAENLITGAASTIATSNLTAGSMLKSDSSGKVATSSFSENDLTNLRNNVDRLNNLLDTDDTTLDQTKEIVAYIKNNKSLIDSITTTKQNAIIGTDTASKNKVLISNNSGKITASSVTSTELGYLSGVSSKIQTQINNLQNLIDGGIVTSNSQTFSGFKNFTDKVSASNVMIDSCDWPEMIGTLKPGWYRIASLTGYQSGYFSVLLFTTGGYSSSKPPHAIFHLTNTHSSPNITQIGGNSGNCFSKIRLTGTEGSYYLDVYTDLTLTGTQIKSKMMFRFVGGCQITQKFEPTTPLASNEPDGTHTCEISTVDIKNSMNFKISDYLGTSTGSGVLFDRSGDITLKLPTDANFRHINLKDNGHIIFNRTDGPNYILTPSASGLAFVFGTTAMDYASLYVSSTEVRPGVNNTISLGTSSKKWSTVYANSFSTDGSMNISLTTNEVNFGGNNTNGTIYMGYRATDSRPLPTKFVFGGSSGSATLQAGSFKGSGADLTSLNASNISSGTIAAARLPAATGSAFGAVKVGSNITVSSGTISLTKANVTAALGYTPPTSDTNTHYTTRLYAGASGTAANAAATNPYLKVTDDNTYRNQVRFVGSGATTVSSDANGNITISSTDTNTNTDTKVTQGRSTSSSYRPLLLHNLYGEYNEDLGTTTESVYYNEAIAAKASTGELKATSFVGSGSGLTSLNASNIASGTLAAARLSTSGVTAGTYGPSAAVTGDNNATMNVPEITVDAYGRVTKVTNRVYTAKNSTYTIPTALKNPNALTIYGGSTKCYAYDGSAAKTLTIKAGSNITVTGDTSGNITIANSYSYSLPTATSSTKGGVTIGSNISVSSGKISLSSANVTSALGYTPVSMKLLWTNSSPTSTFAAQTIQLGDTYNAVIVVYKSYTDGTARITSGPLIADSSLYSLQYTSASGAEIFSRTLTVNSTNVVFDTGCKNDSNNTKYLIPCKIYGIKGVT